MRKLLWVDLEMTGLDVQKEVIIEAAAIITDANLSPLETYEAVVCQPSHYLENMDEWNQKQHSQSGLLEKIPHGKSPHQVEKELVDLVQRHFKKEDPPYLAGNSIYQDRVFIKKYFTQLESLLHYRMLDVSSWKIIFQDKFQLKYEKKGAHRALEDIQESIEEFKFYLSHCQV